MEDILRLKSEANSLYMSGSKLLSQITSLYSDVNSNMNLNKFNMLTLREKAEDLLKHSCILYGESIEKVSHLEAELYEGNNIQMDFVSDSNIDLRLLRPTLFLNLAASNLKLNNFPGALKCCQVGLQLCNNPDLLLCDLTSTDHPVIIIEPIIPEMRGLIVKGLFRRGSCLTEMKDYQEAYIDFQTASRLSLHSVDLSIQLAIISIHSKLFPSLSPSPSLPPTAACTTTTTTLLSLPLSSKSSSLSCAKSTTSSTLSTMVNGGKCWLRQGFWSQSVTEVTVYIPLSLMTRKILPTNNNIDKSIQSSSTIKDKWKIQFSINRIDITNSSIPISSCVLQLLPVLKYCIVPLDCLWTVEDFDVSNKSSSSSLSSSLSSSSSPSSSSTSSSGSYSNNKNSTSSSSNRSTSGDSNSSCTSASANSNSSNNNNNNSNSSKVESVLVLYLTKQLSATGRAMIASSLPSSSSSSVSTSSSSSSVSTSSSSSSSSSSVPYDDINNDSNGHPIDNSCSNNDGDDNNNNSNDNNNSNINHSNNNNNNNINDSEWSPGCEYWDRVFEGDEGIDTVSCSVGSDTSQLPLPACQLAEKEFFRFHHLLSPTQQEIEKKNAIQYKRALQISLKTIEKAVSQEDEAIDQVPERAEMLEALSQEFPHIDFTSSIYE